MSQTKKPYSLAEDELIKNNPDNLYLSSIMPGRTPTAIEKRRSRLRQMETKDSNIPTDRYSKMLQKLILAAATSSKTRKGYSEFDDEIIAKTGSNIRAGIILRRSAVAISVRKSELRDKGLTVVPGNAYSFKRVIKAMLKEGFDFKAYLNLPTPKPLLIDDKKNIAPVEEALVKTAEPLQAPAIKTKVRANQEKTFSYMKYCLKYKASKQPLTLRLSYREWNEWKALHPDNKTELPALKKEEIAIPSPLFAFPCVTYKGVAIELKPGLNYNLTEDGKLIIS